MDYLASSEAWCRLKKSIVRHEELLPTRIQKNDEAVSAVADHLFLVGINPLAEKQNLISISTVRTAPADIARELMKALEISGQCYASFKDEQLEKDQ